MILVSAQVRLVLTLGLWTSDLGLTILRLVLFSESRENIIIFREIIRFSTKHYTTIFPETDLVSGRRTL